MTAVAGKMAAGEGSCLIMFSFSSIHRKEKGERTQAGNKARL